MLELVFNANISSISAISQREQILLLIQTPTRPLQDVLPSIRIHREVLYRSSLGTLLSTRIQRIYLSTCLKLGTLYCPHEQTEFLYRRVFGDSLLSTRTNRISLSTCFQRFYSPHEYKEFLYRRVFRDYYPHEYTEVLYRRVFRDFTVHTNTQNFSIDASLGTLYYPHE